MARLRAGGISAGRISAGGISAGRISAGRISAGRISAGRISAGGISAGGISAGGVGAGGISDPGPTDRMYARVMEITGADPLPYGIEPNRAMIEQLIRHTVSQRILDKPFSVEELFPESTHDLTA